MWQQPPAGAGVVMAHSLLPGKSQSEDPMFAAGLPWLQCLGIYSPAASGVWGRRDFVAHGMLQFGIYRPKMTPKKLLSF